jgi:hypothetical protein
MCVRPGGGWTRARTGLLGGGGSSKPARIASGTVQGRPAPTGVAQSIGAGPSLDAADLFGANVRASPGGGGVKQCRRSPAVKEAFLRQICRNFTNRIWLVTVVCADDS